MSQANFQNNQSVIFNDALATDSSPLSFQINNGTQPNKIYAPTSDPSINQLTLVILATVKATLLPDQVREEDKAGSSSGTLFYLHLDYLNLSSTELDAMSCTADNWSFKVYSDTKTLCMTPTKEITLNPSDTVIVKINKFTLAAPPAASFAQLYMSFYRATPVSSGALPFIYNNSVTLQAPPNAKLNLHDALNVSLDNNNIIQSLLPYPPVQNQFALVFAPGATPKVITAGPKTTFTVGFVYATDQYGYGALATVQQAFDFGVNPGTNVSDWSITPPPKGAQNPAWLLQPPPNQPILGSDGTSTLSFLFSNILTKFQAGATLMTVAYSGVPGYDDGSFYLPINKIAHVEITQFNISPNPVVISGETASVNVSWTVVPGTAALFLDPGKINVSGTNNHNLSLSTSTLVTLSAYGDPQGSIINYASEEKTVDVLPVINSFNGKPSQVYVHDFPHEANLYWDVNSNQNVVIQNVTDGTQDSQPASGTLLKSVNKSTMWTLLAQQNDALPQLQRHVLLQSFEIETGTQMIAQAPGRIAAAPMAQFIAVANPAGNTVSIIDAVTFAVHSGSPISVGQNPKDVAFAYDGTFLYVANGKDATLSVISITLNSTTHDYQFSNVTTLSLPGTPNRIAVSPNDSNIIVSIDNETHPGTIAVIQRDKRDKFSVVQQINVGLSPSGMAFTSSGVQLFVAQAGDNTISVLGCNPYTNTYELVRVISSVGTMPVDLGLAGPNGSTLMIVCNGSNQLIAMDKDNTDKSQRQQLNVGKSPAAIALSSDGAYAFVSNQGDNTITLIGCYNGAGSCTILEDGISSGVSPQSITYASDGHIVFIANTGDNSITTLNLSCYTGLNSSPTVGIQANCIAQAPNMKTYVAWHNALTSSLNPRRNPSPGIYIYDVASQTVTSKLSEIPYIQFIYSPKATDGKGLGIRPNTAIIEVIETQNYSVQLQIPYPNGLQPITLVLTSDSKTLLSIGRNTTDESYSLIVYDTDFSTNTYTNTQILPLSLAKSSTPGNVQLSMTSDGLRVFVMDAGSQQMWCVTKVSDSYQEQTQPIVLNGYISIMTISPDDAFVYLVSQFNKQTGFLILNVQTLQLTQIMLPPSYSQLVNFTDLCISPDGKQLFLTDADVGGIRVVDASTLRIVQTLSLPDIQYPAAIVISSDASCIAFVGQNSNNIGFIRQL